MLLVVLIVVEVFRNRQLSLILQSVWWWQDMYCGHLLKFLHVCIHI